MSGASELLTRRRLLSRALIGCVLIGPAPAFAQNPTSGLYGATGSDGGRRDKLDIEMFLTQSRASDLPSEFRSFLPENDRQAGHRSTMFAASGDYARNRHRVQLSGTASTYLRYGWDLDRMAAVSHHADLHAGVRLSEAGRLRVSQTATYSPAYLYELFPTAAPETLGEAIPVNPAFRTDSTAYVTNGALELGSARGTRVTINAEYGVTDFDRRTASVSNLTTRGAGTRVSHPFSRGTTVSVEYGYESGDYTLGGVTNQHRVTIGVNHAIALSRSRRVTFRLDVSPSVVNGPSGSGATSRYSHFQADAAVVYPFRLKWQAEASYLRAVKYVAGLSEPALSSGATVTLRGAIGRRVDLVALAGHARAQSAVSTNHQDLRSSTGEARIRYALSQAYALYSEYLYFQHDLGLQASLLPDLPVRYEQHEIRVGFTVFLRALGR